MPTYAILGATGATGGSILNYLTQNARPDQSIRLYVRSSEKLHKLRPNLSEHPRISIFEGPSTASTALPDCIRGADVIFSAVAVNENTPGLTIAFDTATAIVAALESFKEHLGAEYKPPVVVVLSASPISPVLNQAIPAILRGVLPIAYSNLYHDLIRAETFYRARRGTGLLDVIFAMPPAIFPGEVPTGFVLSAEQGGMAVSYGDLGAGMVELADRSKDFAWMGVAVVGTGKMDINRGPHIVQLLWGLVAYFLPGLYMRL